VFFKGTSTIRNRMDGVSTYLALTFGTLLSSQGTDASFVLTLSGFPPGASLRSCVSDSIRSFRSDFLGAFQAGAFALSLSGGSDFIRSSFSL
ncbi:hypothetical protein, partial [Streptomyces sp. CNZ748]|uniref:hypothetical protein n=2 Tax=unclassified Streptomyces TaxID=2593676 RepID=UPI001E579C35